MADKSATARTVPANLTKHLRAAIESVKKQGECAFCSGPYAAHRMVDSEIAMFRAGETLEATAHEFDDEPVEYMLMRWLAVFILQADAEAKDTA